MLLTPKSVSNEFIKKALKENISLTPMKLQKLLYFSFGRYLADKDNTLFDEPFEVWQYGPVITSIYDEFKSFGANSITKFAIDANGYAYFPNPESAPVREFLITLENTWSKYKCYDGIALSRLTHAEGSPWHKSNLEDKRHIPNEYIKEYFKENTNA